MGDKKEGNTHVNISGQAAGVVIGSGKSTISSPVTQTRNAAPAPGAPVDETEFKKDVTEVLYALVDAKEKLEKDYLRLNTLEPLAGDPPR
jgi:hypothetical protein